MILIRDIPDIYCDIIEEGLRKPHYNRTTVTELINPPLIKHLQFEKWDEIRVRASEYLWMILGKATHQVFESSGIIKELKHIAENRVLEVDQLQEMLQLTIHKHFAEKPIEVTVKDHRITGRMDFREIGIIKDFKITSVWSFLGGIKPEWENQLNVYAFMSKKNGLPVEKIIIDAILRDWSIVRTYRDLNYPKMPFISMEVPLWGVDKQYNYILQRLAAYKSEPVECSPEEKWQKETTYAVKKPKVKRATRVLNDEKEALKYIKDHENKDLEIEIRPGECTRCLHYCPVRTVCPFSPINIEHFDVENFRKC